MVFVRLLLGGLVALLVIVVSIPAIVLLDLVSGGTGLGLCSTGLGTCSTSTYALMELVVVLVGTVAIVGAGIAGCLHFLQRPASQS
jgi:hypothetical protein